MIDLKLDGDETRADIFLINILNMTGKDVKVDSFINFNELFKPMWDEEHGGLVVAIGGKPFGYIPVIKYESKE